MNYQDPFRTPRELLILRHAKSDWDAGAVTDFARPLAKRGRRDAPRIGAWLYREGLVPDQVLSSPAERARQTAIMVCKRLDFDKRRIHWEPGLYEADLPALLEILAQCPQAAATVLLVGHNPGLEQLLQYLAGDDLEPPGHGKLLPTAALVRLEMPADWTRLEPGCANLLALTRPRQLAD
ncbi:SixA phosphatase family protein [Marichromatium gracile]|uniref:Phosphohistidine phosphatase n=1 Tax=Marichromatium gracile TaxID=1048 RepID=A0ABR5VJV2_MARGR|nr:histidine phosphatase family protein [Marichromatium gracile]KXX66013.1 phosphohistidine phosphatase [Marichromatium gracile]